MEGRYILRSDAWCRLHRRGRGRIRPTLAAVLVVLLAVAVVAPSAFASTRNAPSARDLRAIRILSSIAAHQVHGWSGDSVPLGKLESRLAHGKRIIASCGTVSKLGVLAARRAGYEARLVGSFTRDRLDGDDGHLMMEVKLREGWTVFDLDNNRAASLGVGITELVRDQRWGEVIAHDPQYDVAQINSSTDLSPGYYRFIFAHLDGWYRRVLGVPTIFAHGSYWFHDRRERARGVSMGYHWASGGYWRRLNR